MTIVIYYHLRRCGEIGRRAGLKILWTNHPCRFESDHRHQTSKTILRISVGLFSFLTVFVTLACKNTGIKETYNVSCALECFARAVGGMNKVKYHRHECLSRLRVKIRA